MMVVTAAPIEDSLCSLPYTTANSERSDVERSFAAGESEPFADSIMCNTANHSETSCRNDSKELKGDDLVHQGRISEEVLPLSRVVSDTSIEDFQGSTTLNEEKRHDDDHLIPLGLAKMHPLEGGENVENEGWSRTFLKDESNFSCGGDSYSSQSLHNASDQYKRKKVSQNTNTGFERVSVVDLSTTNSVATGLLTPPLLVSDERLSYSIDEATKMEGSSVHFFNIPVMGQNGHQIDILEGSVANQDFRAVAPERCAVGLVCGQNFDEEKAGGETKSSNNLMVENVTDISEQDVRAENDFSSPSQSLISAQCIDEFGINSCENEATSTAVSYRDEQITEVLKAEHPPVLVSSSGKNEKSTGHSGEDLHKSEYLKSGVESNKCEMNEACLRLSGPSQHQASCSDLSTVPRSLPDGGEEDVEASVLKSSFLCFLPKGHEMPPVFESNEVVERSLQNSSNEDFVKRFSTSKREEQIKAMPSELKKTVFGPGNSELMSFRSTKLEGDSAESDRHTLDMKADDFPVSEHEFCTRSREAPTQDSSERQLETRGAGKSLAIDEEEVVLVGDSAGPDRDLKVDDFPVSEHEFSTRAREAATDVSSERPSENGDAGKSLAIDEEVVLVGDSAEPDRDTLDIKVGDSPVSEHESSTRAREASTEDSFERQLEARDAGKSLAIDEEEVILAPITHGHSSSSSSEDEPAFKIAEFFKNSREGNDHVYYGIEEQQDTSATSLVDFTDKSEPILESSSSLSTPLSSGDDLAFDEIRQSDLLNVIISNDGPVPEQLDKVVPAAEFGRNGGVNHVLQDESHMFPEKWYEDAETGEFTSGTFSGPIPFSGSIPYSGTIPYSGQIPYSGSISLRSDSSTTSTRSFAFPILATEWNSSPVKMAQPDPRFFRRRRRWRFCCFCCKRPSTLFD